MGPLQQEEPLFDMTDVTEILVNWSQASERDRGEVIQALYADLRGQARRHLVGESKVDLHPTSLVNEAYIRLVKVQRMDLSGRTHFFGLAGKLMREVLVDEARKASAQKRDRGLETHLTSEPGGPELPVSSVLELEQLLERLGEIDPLYVRLVEARVFAGLTMEEAAEVLELPLGTAKRKWKLAIAWLREEMASRDATEPLA